MTATTVFIADLDRLAAAGRKTPCQYAHERGDDRWLADDRDARESARADCAGCPVLDACRATAMEQQTQFGVWGAVDWTDPRTRRAARRQHHRNTNRSETTA